MTDNIFFDPATLKRRGRNVIIGKTVRIRHPHLVEIGDDVIIDDFTYISTPLIIDSHVHISAGCKLIGGTEARIEFREYSTLAPNVVLAAGSDDYIAGIATPLVPRKYKGNVEIGTIVIGRHSIVGAGSVVLPDVTFGEGAALGALSLARRDLDPWSLYAGVPARRLRARDQQEIERLQRELKESETGD